MSVLITVASKHAATDEIGEAIADGLARRGVEAVPQPPESATDVAAYEAVVIGSAVYAGHWLPAAKRFVDDHTATLVERPVWLLSSGPVGSPALKPEGDPVDITALMEKTGAIAHRTFAGRIEKSRLSFAERAIVLALRVSEGDFRDWHRIDAFAAEIAGHLHGAVDATKVGSDGS